MTQDPGAVPSENLVPLHEVLASVVELYFIGFERGEFMPVSAAAMDLHGRKDPQLAVAYRAAKSVEAMATDTFIESALALVEARSGGSFRFAEAAREMAAEQVRVVAHLCLMYYTNILRGLTMLPRTPLEYVSTKLREEYGQSFSEAQITLRASAIDFYEKRLMEAVRADLPKEEGARLIRFLPAVP